MGSQSVVGISEERESINIVATDIATCSSAIITSGLPAVSTSHALSLKPYTGLSWTKMTEEKQRLAQSNGQNRTGFIPFFL